MKNPLLKSLLCVLSAAALMMCALITEAHAAVKHNVTYIYGAKSQTVQVSHGQNAPVPTDTAVPGFTFLSWVGSAANVTEDRVILGAYAKNAASTPVAAPAASVVSSYTKKINSNKSAPWPEWWKDLNLPKGVPGQTCAVHWYNGWNGELWKTDMVPYGASLPTPADPCLAGYDFAGWEGDWTNVTEDRAIRAWYYETNTVKYYDSTDGDLIDIHKARNGESDWVAPPSHDGKEFVHYVNEDGSTFNNSNINDDTKVFAVYQDKDKK